MHFLIKVNKPVLGTEAQCYPALLPQEQDIMGSTSSVAN